MPVARHSTPKPQKSQQHRCLHFLYRDGRSAPRSVPPPGIFCPNSLDLKANPVPLQNWPVGGKLGHLWRVWAEIGSSRRWVRWIRHGCPLRFVHEAVASRDMPLLTRASPSYLVVNYQGTVRKVALENMVQQLLDKRCVRVIADVETGFYSRVFLFPKRSRWWHLVIDLLSRWKR